MRGLWLATLALALVACRRGGETGTDAGAPSPSAAAPLSSTGIPVAVAETMPRCRAEGAALPLAGDDVVVGEVALESGALLVGLARRDGGKRVASVARIPLDLASLKTVDVGPALGDDPPPAPRVNGGVAYAAWYARPAPSSAATPAGAPSAPSTLARELRIARLETPAAPLGVVVQQADESFAFDVAWPEGAPDARPLVAWDEDAPRKLGAILADRGVVKVQVLGAPASSAKVVTPETSDAEEPHLLRRKGGGYWLAWLARRPEAVDAGDAPEGPGERRAFRWVELVALDAKGEPQGTPRRLTSERGRVASFELSAPAEAEKGELFAVVVDETAPSEGAGARLLGITLDGDRVDTSELAASGVAHASAELLPAPAGARERWLAWTDVQERVVLAPLGRPAGAGVGGAKPTTETAFGSARPLAALPRGLVTASAVKAAEGGAAGGPVELRRYVCE